MSMRIAVLVGCVSAVTALALQPLSAGGVAVGTEEVQRGKPSAPEFATFSVLPSLGSNSVAWEVNAAGTIIVGQAYDRDGFLHAVKWTLQNGSWVLTDLGWPSGANSATARGVNNQGDAAGNDFPGPTSRPVLWPATGGVTILGCASDLGRATVYGISDGQVVVGSSSAGGAAVWQPGNCRENLPPLIEGRSSGASAVSGDGTIVGGSAGLAEPSIDNSLPVRWKKVGGQWLIEQLDSLNGSVRGGNAAGDLAGYIFVPCGSDNDCQRAVIWYAAGGFRQLGTLGGDDSAALDVNASGEVVGISTSPRIGNTAFFWSQSAGMVQLPFKGRAAAAYSLSDVRADGTRVVVGARAGDSAVWVVRNP